MENCVANAMKRNKNKTNKFDIEEYNPSNTHCTMETNSERGSVIIVTVATGYNYMYHI